MLKAYRALRGETREIAVRPWMYRIARNESISALRGRRPLGELEEAVGVAAAGADVEAASRERLADLVADLRSLPERQRSALVLRELSGLDYEELGAALDVSPNAARQTVFKARVSMQQNVEGRTAHCDEVRAAMSKSDARFRRRRSIQAHLDRCPVCTEFAAGLESRPRDLAALFPPLPAGVAAAVVAAAASGGGGAAAGGAAAGAGGGGAAAGAGAAAGKGAAATTGAGSASASAPAASPAAASAARSSNGGERKRRVALFPLLLFLLLVAGTIATALLLDNGGGGGGGSNQVAQGTGSGSKSAAGSHAKGSGGTRPKGSHSKGAAGGTHSKGSHSKGAAGGTHSKGSHSKGSHSKSAGGSHSKGSGSGSGGGTGSGNSGSNDSSGRVNCVRRTRAATSPAQEGYSGRAGRIEVRVVEDCTRTRSAGECSRGSSGGGSGSGSGSGSGNGSGSGSGSGSGNGSGNGSGSGSGGGSGSGNGSGSASGSANGSASGQGSGSGCTRTTRDGLPITGLELGLLSGSALLLLALGFGLRRLSAQPLRND
jgi:RNA polymerase sigma factor (sigma-70 family)